MKLEEIGFYTLCDKRAKNLSLDTPLWRCELLLTDKCNFNCPYCRGSNEYTAGTLSFEDAKHVVDLWGDGNLKNIRFSGGEPTLFDGIVDLIAHARKRGIERVAISTNGSADADLYSKMVEAGANDFSISLDACCASTGDMMAGGIKGIWQKVIDNIKCLSQISYTTVGIVLTEENFDELIETIEYASSLEVSDIRIISAAQWNNKDKFKKLFSKKKIIDKYPILKYRINNFLNDENVRGIEENDCHRCGLVIDDMAIANNYHFPCIIALREGAKPIGSIKGKTIGEIRQERFDWFKKCNTFKSK
ncbi:MAG: radical SAM protein, partial [bacterium]